jgi:dephospho-CoA kinase
VVDRFGRQVLTGEGVLDRAALGAIVFADPQARRELEAIIHPAVRARAAAIEAAADPGDVIVHVIPLLVETGQQEDFDVLVVVDLPPESQLERLRRRNGLDADAARARIAAQATRAARLAVADVVLDNSTTPEDLIDQVDSLWSDLRARATAG